jgi:hypothetical protein
MTLSQAAALEKRLLAKGWKKGPDGTFDPDLGRAASLMGKKGGKSTSEAKGKAPSEKQVAAIERIVARNPALYAPLMA